MNDHPLLYTHRLFFVLFLVCNRFWSIEYFPTKSPPPGKPEKQARKTRLDKQGLPSRGFYEVDRSRWMFTRMVFIIALGGGSGA